MHQVCVHELLHGLHGQARLTRFGIKLELLVVDVCYYVAQLLDRNEFLANRCSCAALRHPMVRANVVVINALVVLDVGLLRQDVVHDGLAGGLLVLMLRWLLRAELLSVVQLLLKLVLSVESSTDIRIEVVS